MSEAKAPPAAAPASGGGGGIKALLPLILTVALMPVLAFVMTSFVMVPALQKATVQARADGEKGEKGEPGDEAHGDEEGHGQKDDAHGAKDDGHGKKDDGHGGGHGGGAAPSKNVQFGKVLVNVSGTLGARYLLTNFTLVGKDTSISSAVEEKKDQLTDAALSTLRTKTIQELERQGAANMIRTELLSVFNNILGKGMVKELYFTEFAIQ